MKTFVKCLLGSVLLLCPFLMVWVLGVSAMNPAYHPGEAAASRFETAVVKFAGKVKREFAARVHFFQAENEPALGEQFLASDPSHLETRDATIESLFSGKSGFHFTQVRFGAETKPCQIDGLTLAGPYPQLVSEADKISGVDRKLSYRFQAKQHRLFNSETGWQEWKTGLPAKVDNIILVRQGDSWVTSYLPASLSPLPRKNTSSTSGSGIQSIDR